MLITIEERYASIIGIFEEIGEGFGMKKAHVSRIVNSIYRCGKFVLKWENPYVYDLDENGDYTKEWELFNRFMFMRFLDDKLYEKDEFLRARGCGVRTAEFLRMVGETMRERGI